MALHGPPPNDRKIGRTPNVHEWIDVPNVPYAGPRPPVGRVPAATKRWWEAISTQPHCALWDAGAWEFALATARIHAAFSKGELGRAQELRIREREMGTTHDARRALRIRYVDQNAQPGAAETVPAEVSDFQAERRKRISDAG